jgi:2-oxoglutarate/2-oxoacid ferredoxin oxidoreductase subunit beta
MKNLKSYSTNIAPTWCPGCGNFLVKACLEKVFTRLSLPKKDIVIAYDIGCAGNMADFLDTYGVHTLHGRAVPIAMGVKIANSKLTVIVIGGDGGIYGEGLNHLLTAARANIDITTIVSNNCLYSLTTGQTSPTTPKGAKTKSTPQGSLLIPLDPVLTVKNASTKAWAEKSTTKPKDLEEKIFKAITNKGFSLLDIKQECIAFGKLLER